MKKNNFYRGIQILSCFAIVLFIVNCSSSDNGSGGTTQTNPQILPTGAITSFGSVDVLSNSASQSMQVKGSNLVGSLSLSTTTNFEISLDDSNFSSQVSIDKDVANAGNTTVYVRFSPIESAIGNNSGSLSIQSSQATTVTVALTGSGVSIAPIINVTGTIDSFGDVMLTNNSMEQSIVVNGDNLMSDITVTASTDFEVSLDNNTYAQSVQIPVATANEDTTLYVRFSPANLGMTTGTLTLSNTDTADTLINLDGNGTPVRHNYVTFNQQPLGFGGGFNQSAAQVFNLHTDLSNIAQIKMYLQIDCPSTGCDDWDRFANVKVKDPSTGNWLEIGRYITPYWVGTGLLERGLEFDVTDFKGLLTGATELRIYIENWTSKADLVSVDFDFIEGTPDYPYYAVSEVLGYHANSIDGVPYGVSHSFDLDKQITIPANAESTHLRTIISGWGHATPNDPGARPCAEWCFRTHDVKINGVTAYSHNLGPIGCADNPINNQNPGNWTPDRAGWCPGMAVPTRIDNFGSPMAGSSFMFEYDFEDWTNDGLNGSAYYATSTYVVVKSNSVITAPTVAD